MKTWIKVIIGLIVVGLIAVFLGYTFIYNKQHTDYENAEASFSMNAEDLYQAFKRDATNASAQYNGKVITLAGKLSKIETADSLVTAVFVFNQGDFGDEGIRCTMLKKFNNEANRLQPDGEIIVKGYCTGYNETDVIMEKCSLINQ
jgi:hypothetical protein